MSSFRIRPRFKLQVKFDIDQIQNKIANELKKTNQQCNANINNTFITLSLSEKDIQYWSPQLRLSIEKNEEGTLIRGLYGPKPSIWALFFYFYAAFGILGFFFRNVWHCSVKPRYASTCFVVFTCPRRIFHNIIFNVANRTKDRCAANVYSS